VVAGCLTTLPTGQEGWFCDFVLSHATMSAMATSEPASPRQQPTVANALIGAAGLSARVMASAALGATAAARAVTRPAATVVRGGLATPPGQAARAEASGLIESLDAAGRRDLVRAQAELNAALDRATDRFITDLLASQRAKQAIERVLESDELWKLVDRIANSPEVLNAVANASVGLTGVVADEARKRTVTADEFAERVARRVLRRAPREPQPLALETAAGENGPPQP
jgi:hypothetical protein